MRGRAMCARPPIRPGGAIARLAATRPTCPWRTWLRPRRGSLAPPAAECAPTVPAHTLVAPTSPSNPPTSSVSDVRQQGRKGRFWFYAAAVVAAAVPISAVLILGANGPLLHMGGAGQATRGYWDLSDWTVLGALAVLGLGVPCAALLAFTGIAYRTNPKSVWWIAAVLLGTLGLKILLG